MKTVTLLMISALLFGLSSCNTRSKKDTKGTENFPVRDTLFKVIDSDPFKQSDSSKMKKDTSLQAKTWDTIDPRLKVVVEGKVYFKKNLGDYKYDGLLYQFYDEKAHRDYDIRTGKYFPGPALWETGLLETDQ